MCHGRRGGRLCVANRRDGEACIGGQTTVVLLQNSRHNGMRWQSLCGPALVSCRTLSWHCRGRMASQAMASTDTCETTCMLPASLATKRASFSCVLHTLKLQRPRQLSELLQRDVAHTYPLQQQATAQQTSTSGMLLMKLESVSERRGGEGNRSEVSKSRKPVPVSMR